MTPAARLQAAIEILDAILSEGRAAEQALTGWARRSRFAGSKDRAAVRDHVFDALRCKRSLAALGGVETGRGLVLGQLRRDGVDPDGLFNGTGYGPAPLSDSERAAGRPPQEPDEALDIPAWLWPEFQAVPEAEACARAMQHRAPVHLRVNIARTKRSDALASLAGEGILCEPHPASDTALQVTEGARKIRNCAPYRDGLIELQDAASQAVVDALPLHDGIKVLDYCAGGGGKVLAMAARVKGDFYAHDIAAERMRDLPARADRAGTEVTLLPAGEPAAQAPFDLVLCDAPCSGSGAWRRSPEGKWALTPERLAEIQEIQADILGKACDLVAPGGTLAYATCSVLACENHDQVSRFLADHPDWNCVRQEAWSLAHDTDGFFAAHLTRMI